MARNVQIIKLIITIIKIPINYSLLNKNTIIVEPYTITFKNMLN